MNDPHLMRCCRVARANIGEPYVAETRHEALQRQLTCSEVESYLYWHALMGVGLAKAYRQWAPKPIPTWACEWNYQLWRPCRAGKNLN